MATAETPKAFKIANMGAIVQWSKKDIKDGYRYIREFENDPHDWTHKDWTPIVQLTELLERPFNDGSKDLTEFCQCVSFHHHLRKKSSFYNYWYKYVKSAIGWTGKKGILDVDDVQEYIRQIQTRNVNRRFGTVAPPSDSEDDIGTDDDIAPIED